MKPIRILSMKSDDPNAIAYGIQKSLHKLFSHRDFNCLGLKFVPWFNPISAKPEMVVFAIMEAQTEQAAEEYDQATLVKEPIDHNG